MTIFFSDPSKLVKMDTKQGRFEVRTFQTWSFFIGYLPSEKCCVCLGKSLPATQNEQDEFSGDAYWKNQNDRNGNSTNSMNWIFFFWIRIHKITTIILFFSFSFVLYSREQYQRHTYTHIFFCLSASKKKGRT